MWGLCLIQKLLIHSDICLYSLLEASIDSIHVIHHLLQAIYTDVILHFKMEDQPAPELLQVVYQTTASYW